MRLPMLCVLTLASVLASRARAESPVGVLVLPTQIGGSVPDRAAWQKAFDQRIEDAVRRSGRTPRLSGPLTASEASCRDAACLARLAEGASADIVLLGRVVADRGTPPSYKLTLLRYDRERAGSVRHEESDCSVCTEVEAAERLEQMVKQVLPSLVVVQPRHVDPVPVPVVPAPVVP